ncbi:MAG TPA: sporulation initiation factor Spo0A C-terminal domain-containing protein [Clostridia bacterium]|nr:sporulation initiation factor Spo0A C-terminal domain-containing protein [Clostridia bacterium]
MNFEIVSYLDQKNISHSVLGFAYLASAINLAIKNPELKYHTTELYRAIASTHKTTPTSVERCIRHAIEKSGCAKIVNREFISIAVDSISPNFDWNEDKQ